MEPTLLIIKPDGVARQLVGQILAKVESAGFVIRDLKMIRLTQDDARRFYYVHQGKPFLDELTNYISSGPIVVAHLEKKQAISDLRKLIGATDPRKAAEGTIRRTYGQSITVNTVHASDSEESAEFEVGFFFPGATQGDG